MSKFINTIDVLGDDAVLDSIIDQSITEFKDNIINSVNQYMFHNCKKLTTVDLPAVTQIGTVFCYGCGELVDLKVPALTKTLSSFCSRCYKLKTLSFNNLTAIDGSDFLSNSSAFESLILRNTNQVCELNYYLNNTTIASGTAYVYVPAALIDSYKAKGKWSTYTTQFRALEDYTVDGTTTGELDPNKI